MHSSKAKLSLIYTLQMIKIPLSGFLKLYAVYRKSLQSTKILLMPLKCEIIFGTIFPIKLLLCQHCSSKVIALNLFASFLSVLLLGSWLISCIASHVIIAIVVALLHSERCQLTITEIFSLSSLRARKSDNYRYRNSWKSNNFWENNQEKKQRAGTKNKAKKIKSDNFTGINREKSNICYCKINDKFRILVAPIVFSLTVFTLSGSGQCDVEIRFGFLM